MNRLRTELALIEKQVTKPTVLQSHFISKTICYQIFDLETTYLEETKDFGNVFTGWDSYLSVDKVKIRKTVLNEERLFSLSSVTSPASRREETKKVMVETFQLIHLTLLMYVFEGGIEVGHTGVRSEKETKGEGWR